MLFFIRPKKKVYQPLLLLLPFLKAISKVPLPEQGDEPLGIKVTEFPFPSASTYAWWGRISCIMLLLGSFNSIAYLLRNLINPDQLFNKTNNYGREVFPQNRPEIDNQINLKGIPFNIQKVLVFR